MLLISVLYFLTPITHDLTISNDFLQLRTLNVNGHKNQIDGEMMRLQLVVFYKIISSFFSDLCFFFQGVTDHISKSKQKTVYLQFAASQK